jgi:hypothetical protein
MTKNNKDFELEDFFTAAKQTAPEVSETLRRQNFGYFRARVSKIKKLCF